jgi:hypothetical protein
LFYLLQERERASEQASGGDLCGRHGNHPLTATHPSGRLIPRRLERLLCALPRQPCGATISPQSTRVHLCSRHPRRVEKMIPRWRSLHARRPPRTTRRARVLLPPDTLAGQGLMPSERVGERTRESGSRPRSACCWGSFC